MPVAINLSTISLLWFVPFNNISLKYDFQSKLRQRSEVITQIKLGKISERGEYSDRILKLPQGYKHLSIDGEVIFEQDSTSLRVLFFTFRGILDNFSGFAYCADNKEPVRTTFDGDIRQVVKMGEYWYFIASW